VGCASRRFEKKGTGVSASPQLELASALGAIPSIPAGWALLCSENELRHGPAVRQVAGQRLVVFRTATGQVGVLDSRCAHLGADLTRGRVVGEALECPYHSWSYRPDGTCDRVPADPTAACDVRQTSYPAEVRHGFVYYFHAPRALYPLPFYDAIDPGEFVCSKPIEIALDCPWYMVGVNAFDFQHLHAVHERRLLDTPLVDSPTPWSRAATTRSVVGSSTWYDRVMRTVSGPHAEMTATSWAGSLIFVRVQFARMTTYGMVSVRPAGERKTVTHILAYLPRSRRRLLDVARLRIRRFFIHQFLRADGSRLDGLRAGPLHLIGADRELREYLLWLASVSNGLPADTVATRNTRVLVSS
jgi:phenylpropionate dioxygenase-like ring-hydroxylating dioxygenase large terminal subunit